MGKTNKEKRRLILISGFILILIGFLSFNVYKDFVIISNNKHQKVKLQSEYDELLAEEVRLESSVAKMQDPDYVARYAKEKYLYSSDDEIIIRIDE